MPVFTAHEQAIIWLYSYGLRCDSRPHTHIYTHMHKGTAGTAACNEIVVLKKAKYYRLTRIRTCINNKKLRNVY